jgi:hypothetical protein
MGMWKLLGEVGRLAREDQNVRVRRYALVILKSVTDSVQKEQRSKTA